MQSDWRWKDENESPSYRVSSLAVDGYEVVGEQAADDEEVTIAYVLDLSVRTYMLKNCITE